MISNKPDVLGGMCCIDGTRIPVFFIQNLNDEGFSVEEIVEMYPHLSAEQVTEAIN